MNNKISLVLILFLGGSLVGMLGNALYRDAWIFPPTKPANMEELTTWSELDLWRLKKHYKCEGLPSDLPDDLKELKRFCKTVTVFWSKKYDEMKIKDARDIANKLRQPEKMKEEIQ